MSAESPKKPILFFGIGLLIAGILLRRLSDYQNLGLLVILFGVGLKTYYIIRAIRSGLYTPGKEIWLLFAGLTFFLGGLYLRGESIVVKPTYLIVFGLSLKVLFIIRFIQKVRINRQKVFEN